MAKPGSLRSSSVHTASTCGNPRTFYCTSEFFRSLSRRVVLGERGVINWDGNFAAQVQYVRPVPRIKNSQRPKFLITPFHALSPRSRADVLHPCDPRLGNRLFATSLRQGDV